MNASLNTTRFSPAPAAASTQPLWAALGVLSICVVSMGATLVHVNKRVEPLAQISMPLALSYTTDSPAALTAITAEEKAQAKPRLSPAKSSQAATKPVANEASARVVPQAPAPTSTPAICKTCGTIEAVTPITKQAPASGLGVIAGGVLGGVVGNQIGKGHGRAATTVIGAIGGGWAGNAIEKNMKKTTVYSVRVKMEDGTRRTLEQHTAPVLGSKVTVDGSALRPA